VIDAVIGAHPVAPRDVVDAVHYVFRKSPMAITIATADGRFVVANQAASELYGRPVEDFPGRSWQDVGAGSNVDEIIEAYSRAVTGEAEAAAVATEVVRPDGTARRVMVSGHPIRDGAGEVLWFFNVLQPV
jgi:PAS domain S-box-containing protein